MYQVRGSSGSYSQAYNFSSRKEAEDYAKSVLDDGWERVLIDHVRPMSAYTLTYKTLAMWVREGAKMVKVVGRGARRKRPTR